MSAYCMTGLLHELVYWTSGLMHTVETDTSVQPMSSALHCGRSRNVTEAHSIEQLLTEG